MGSRETEQTSSAGATRFGSLLLGTAAVLAVALIAALFASGPLAWAVGIIYVAYDTWLLGHMVLGSRLAIAGPRAAPGPGDVRPTLAVLVSARNERLALPP